MSMFGARVSSLRRSTASAARMLRTPGARHQNAPLKARPTHRFLSRGMASGASNGQQQQHVTKQMLVNEGKAILKLMIGSVVVVSGLMASSGLVIETVKGMNPMPAPGRFVELRDDDGNAVKVHYQRRGSGNVTVVLDGGVGETSFDWDKVTEQVAPFATVVAIDRPGLGFSTRGSKTQPRTAEQAAKEYAEVLTKLSVPRKIVLVAHGAGGYNMRQLAEDLQQDANAGFSVQGLVLVDALQENLRAELESVSEPVRKALETMDKNGDTVLTLARLGLVRLITTVQRKKNEAKYSKEALPYVEFYSPTPAHREAANAENAALPATEQRFRDASLTKRFNFPCVVLSHGRADMFDSMKLQAGVDMMTIAALEGKWEQAQRTLATTIAATPAVQIKVADAGHNIHHEKPEEIVKVVRALVKEARQPDSDEGLKTISEGTCPV